MIRGNPVKRKCDVHPTRQDWIVRRKRPRHTIDRRRTGHSYIIARHAVTIKKGRLTMNEQFKITLTDNTPPNADGIIKAVDIALDAGMRLDTLDSMLGALHRLAFTLMEDIDDCNPEQLAERLEQILAMVDTMKGNSLPIILGEVDAIVKTFNTEYKHWQGVKITYPGQEESADTDPDESDFADMMP